MGKEEVAGLHVGSERIPNPAEGMDSRSGSGMTEGNESLSPFVLPAQAGIQGRKRPSVRGEPVEPRRSGDAPFDKLSNCVGSQAYTGFHGVRFLTIELRMVKSFLMQAVMATFFGLPASTKRS